MRSRQVRLKDHGLVNMGLVKQQFCICGVYRRGGLASIGLGPGLGPGSGPCASPAVHGLFRHGWGWVWTLFQVRGAASTAYSAGGLSGPAPEPAIWRYRTLHQIRPVSRPWGTTDQRARPPMVPDPRCTAADESGSLFVGLGATNPHRSPAAPGRSPGQSRSLLSPRHRRLAMATPRSRPARG